MPLIESIEKPLAAERTAGSIAVFSNSYPQRYHWASRFNADRLKEGRAR
jgi:hypothetical protein